MHAGRQINYCDNCVARFAKKPMTERQRRLLELLQKYKGRGGLECIQIASALRISTATAAQIGRALERRGVVASWRSASNTNNTFAPLCFSAL
jgi:predicted ArsR family transcriptional regulator